MPNLHGFCAFQLTPIILQEIESYLQILHDANTARHYQRSKRGKNTLDYIYTKFSSLAP